MSAYTKLQTHLLSAEDLVRALADVGFGDVELHQTAQPLQGYEGGTRRETAEVIIRKCHLDVGSNDIGFQRGADGRFVAIISEFDREHFGAAWLMSVKQRYAYHVARRQLESQDFALVEESAADDGTIRLTLRRMV